MRVALPWLAALVLLALAVLAAATPVSVAPGGARFSQLHLKRGILMPTIATPPGFTDTGATFHIKGFIPGPGCAPNAMPTSSYVTGSALNFCSGNGAPIDGITDTMAYPTPATISTFFRVDERCFSSDINASPRIQVICKIFKQGAQFKVGCAANAGVTRHYRHTLPPGRCYTLSCQRRDGLSASFTTAPFTAGQTVTLSQLSISGGDPCVTTPVLPIPVPAPPARVDASQSTISITGNVVSIRLKGRHTQFPAIEAYGFGGIPSTPTTLYQRLPVGPWHILTTTDFDTGVKTFSCTHC